MQKRKKLTPREKGLARGREAGAEARNLPATMRATFKRWEVLYATAADMDFASPPAVVKAIKQRAAHPIYGYTSRSDSYFDGLVAWMKKRNGWDIKKD